MKKTSDLSDYYTISSKQPPSPLLLEAIRLVKRKNSALDMGAGAGRDTVYLLEQGFNNVTAVDKSSESVELLKKLEYKNLNIVQSSFDEFIFDTYDLINAQWSLFFNNKNTFYKMFDRLKNSLKKDGIFVGQFLGVHDEWNTKKSLMSFFCKNDIVSLLSSMKVEKLVEKDIDGKLANGTPKHWHVFHIIAVK